jgi:hypothetical protein
MRAYHDFYAVAPTDRDLRTLTVELLAADGRHGLQLIARDRLGEAVGFVMLLFIRSTTTAALAAVMNDLRTGPAARGGRGRRGAHRPLRL